MLPYWILFLLPAFLAGGTSARTIKRRDRTLRVKFDGAMLLIFLVVFVMIGFRNYVGGDWSNYVGHVEFAQDMTLSEARNMGDPGYWVLVVLGVKSGLGVLFVNLVAALVFSVGLFVYCSSLPRPFLAVTCAIPYLVVVVAMGYTRQSMAIGLIMIGLASLRRGGIYSFVALALCGALFHKSAVVVIPIVATLRARNRVFKFLFAIGAGALGYISLLSDSLDHFMVHYVQAGYQSSGTLLRLLMNAIPSVLFMLFHKRMDMSVYERQLYLVLSFLSLAALVAFFATSASTALDRLALYLIPAQLFVFSRVPDALSRRGSNRQALVAGVIFYHGLVLYVWLNFGANSFAWRPYHSFLW